MAMPRACAIMPVPADLQALADSLAIKENPRNGHQITTGPPIPEGVAALALPSGPTGTLWDNGRTLRVKILNGGHKVKSKIRQYASVWTQYANIKMVFVDSGDAEIRVNVDSSNASWSAVGTNCLTMPDDRPTMNFGWLTDSTDEDEYSRVITHEFGHAMGCIHEHASPAAGIPWNKPAVYAYYARPPNYWTKAQVDTNIFQLYSTTTTNSSQFDPESVMLYAIPAALTMNGYSTSPNSHLSETDKSFIRRTYPAESLEQPYFNTQEVRPWSQPAKEAVKRQVFAEKWTSPPGLVMGLNMLDVANTANIRVSALADNVKTTSADIHIDTWGDTTLFSAGCTWFKAATDDPDYQIGTFSTQDDHSWDRPQMKTSRNITFWQAYAAPPEIVVWLNSLDMARDKGWRINAYADNITDTGFTIHLDTWGDTTLYSAEASWIAYPANKANVASGVYNTQDVRAWDNPQLRTSGRVNFPANTFSGNPKVVIAYNTFDVACVSNLRLMLSADSVSPSGMNWHLDSWGDTILYSAGAQYIAFS